MIDVDLICGVLIFVTFLISESYFFIADNPKESQRIVVNSWIAIIVAMFIFTLHYFIRSTFAISLITEFCIMLYIITSEFLFYENQIKIKTIKKPKQMFVVIFGSIALISLIGYSYFKEGGIFGSSDNWFSETFLSLISSANMVAVMTLMIIGSFVIIMAKARRQPNMGVAGYFLVVGLPLFDLIQTLFSKTLQEDIVDSAIYTAFENVALALIIFMIMKMIFYMLMISVVVSMLSQLE